jgi:hypothetical protein
MRNFEEDSTKGMSKGGYERLKELEKLEADRDNNAYQSYAQMKYLV